jgi:hypothetical protein
LRALDALGVELTAGAMDAGRAGANSPAPVVTADIDAIVADARRRDRP